MKHVLKPSDITASLKNLEHRLSPQYKRAATSLGDLTGLKGVGIHFVVIEPGMTSTEHHSHDLSEEYMYILEGSATLILGDERIAIEAGDFVGLPAKGPAHSVHNTGSTKLVYLMGGDRLSFDICKYPKLDKRVYMSLDGDERVLDFVKDSDIDQKRFRR